MCCDTSKGSWYPLNHPLSTVSSWKIVLGVCAGQVCCCCCSFESPEYHPHRVFEGVEGRSRIVVQLCEFANLVEQPAFACSREAESSPPRWRRYLETRRERHRRPTTSTNCSACICGEDLESNYCQQAPIAHSLGVDRQRRRLGSSSRNGYRYSVP